MEDFGMFGAIIGMVLAMLAILAPVLIANYVLMGIGLMKMAKNQQVEMPWLAWIPFGQYWIIGKLIKDIEFGEKKFEKAEIILLVGAIASIILANIPLIGGLISLAWTILIVYVIYTLYKLYAPEKAILYTVLSVVFVVLAPGIILFILRDKPQLGGDNTPDVEVV